MKKIMLFFAGFLPFVAALGQNVASELRSAFQAFEADPQLKHAISSFYVIDARTGDVVFEKNGTVGLAPASTQKIITSVTAFELLGKDYRYKTSISYVGDILNKKLTGDILLSANGDPTFGSWRYAASKEKNILHLFTDAIRKKGIREISGRLLLDGRAWESESIPDGWIWQDIGNYYGAGVSVFNWRENQYDVLLRSGTRVGDPVEIARTEPMLKNYPIESKIVSASKGTGDNAYIFILPNSQGAVIRGTIPVEESQFRISGAMMDPLTQFSNALSDSLKASHIIWNGVAGQSGTTSAGIKELATYYSPTLDSIIYWFNKRSINLYGEALVKTMGYEKKGFGVTDSGLVVLKEFWKKNGLNDDELNMKDGSGLSPLNRVTTRSQVKILQYAKSRSWYPYFLDALPEYNAMKMKSGTISDVKGFCGYHTSKDGKEYIFSFLVNNYSGRASELVRKMYKVLDYLK
jgi:D-alanyl-D-alanine carboxypeptidase/D-alanyl-D-alanine-endopeptidase (penicillin-binding protein 4)